MRYHNNSCTHKIIVRQGYDAHKIGKRTAKWSAFNVYNDTSLTRSPLSIGSIFRRYSTLEYPIAEENNYRDNYGVDQTFYWTLKIHGKEKESFWRDIPANTTGAEATFTSMNLYNYTTREETGIPYPRPVRAARHRHLL